MKIYSISPEESLKTKKIYNYDVFLPFSWKPGQVLLPQVNKSSATRINIHPQILKPILYKSHTILATTMASKLIPAFSSVEGATWGADELPERMSARSLCLSWYLVSSPGGSRHSNSQQLSPLRKFLQNYEEKRHYNSLN